MRPPILFIHALFGHAGVFEPWVRHFEAAGYECHAPSLPGRDPTDLATLRGLTMQDNLDAVLTVREGLGAPPIVVGHSMGGLLAQQVAARTPCAALVCLASVPPGVLWPQLRSLPQLARVLPSILAGRAFLPAERIMRAAITNDLTDDEHRRVNAQFVPDSGRAFRSMIFGLNRVPRGAVRCPVLCVSGGADRNVAARTSRRIAKRYHATHRAIPGKGHWIIAGSGVAEIAPVVTNWLQAEVIPGGG